MALVAQRMSLYALRTGACMVVALLVVSSPRRSLGEPIHDAAKKNDLAALGKLLAEDPGLIDKTGPGGMTPLQVAIRSGKGSIETITFLLDHKADPNSYGADQGRRSPLLLAVMEKDEPVVALLLKRGAEADPTDVYGTTPFHWAVVKGELEMAKLLARSGANMGNVDGLGNTPLHIAAVLGNQTMVEFLLAGGAPREFKNKYGKTPAQLAKNKTIENLILNYSSASPATASAAGATNQSPLPYCFEYVKKPGSTLSIYGRKVDYDSLSEGICDDLAGQLASHGFQLQSCKGTELPRVFLELDSAELVNKPTEIVILKATLRISHGDQVLVTKHFSGSGVPGPLDFRFSKKPATLASSNLAGTAASDQELLAALRAGQQSSLQAPAASPH